MIKKEVKIMNNNEITSKLNLNWVISIYGNTL